MAILSFSCWRRIGYHHIVMVFVLIAIVFFSILLAGCTTPNLNNVYLLSISYINAGTPNKVDPVQINPNISDTFSAIAGSGSSTVVEVRAGYMGMCIRQSVGLWVCSNRDLALANLIKDEHSGGGAADPLSLIWIAGNFRNQIIFDGLIYASIPLAVIAILLLASYPGWHEEEEEEEAEVSERDVKPYPWRSVSQAVSITLALASAFAFVSTFWQHVSSSAAAIMAHSLAYGTVNGHVGSVAMVLGWGGVIFLVLATIMIVIMAQSVKVLSEIERD